MSVREEESESYMNDRRAIKREGYVVIFSDTMTLPLSCPVCDVVMRTRVDEEEFQKHSCCSLCAKLWAYPNVEKWKNGWRPSKSEIAEQPKAFTEFTFKID